MKSKMLNVVLLEYIKVALIGLVLVACNTIQLDHNPDGYSCFPLVNENIESYLAETDYSKDNDYKESYVSNYRVTPITDQTRPLPVTISWEIRKSYESLRLLVSENTDYSHSWVYSLEGEAVSKKVYNLIPNKVYYWRLIGIDEFEEQVLESKCIYTTGSRRFILIPGDYIGNCRDLGGLSCGNNKFIQFGRLFRGAELLRDDGGPYMKISEEGIYELKERIGCSVELDIGDLWRESPLEGKGFEVYKDHDVYGFYGYDRADRGLRTLIGRECLHNSLELIIQKLTEKKSIYFHCNSGADRTGTLAFIIESLCGVNDDDKSKDYELTSLWAFYYKEPYNRYTRNPNRFRNAPAEGDYGYNTMVAYINSSFEGDSLNDKVYNMCISSIDNNGLGLSDSMIDDLRKNLVVDL